MGRGRRNISFSETESCSAGFGSSKKGVIVTFWIQGDKWSYVKSSGTIMISFNQSLEVALFILLVLGEQVLCKLRGIVDHNINLSIQETHLLPWTEIRWLVTTVCLRHQILRDLEMYSFVYMITRICFWATLFSFFKKDITSCLLEKMYYFGILGIWPKKRKNQ